MFHNAATAKGSFVLAGTKCNLRKSLQIRSDVQYVQRAGHRGSAAITLISLHWPGCERGADLSEDKASNRKYTFCFTIPDQLLYGPACLKLLW